MKGHDVGLLLKGEITRGIATAFAAPVLKDKLMSASELVLIWPDAKGSIKGQAVEPLFKMGGVCFPERFRNVCTVSISGCHPDRAA